MPNEPSNVGVPKTFSGARARFKIDGNPIAYAGGVSGDETIKSVA